jgi:hypothetical protein
MFLDLRSPGTIRNLATNPVMEVNVVDPILRKGYRFNGEARVVRERPLFERILAFFDRPAGEARAAVRAAVLLRVERVAPLLSPAYDRGESEQEVAARWRHRHLELTRAWGGS